MTCAGQAKGCTVYICCCRLAVEAAGVPARQTVLVVPQERDASLDMACQLLDLQTAVLVPAASQVST